MILAITKVMPLLLLLAVANPVKALTIKNVSHEKIPLGSSQFDRVNIRFALDETASVTLNIYDGRDYLVRQIGAQGLTKGDNAMSWDLADNAGNRVPDGHYHYTLTATGSVGDPVTYDTTDLTGGDLVLLKNLEWDKKTNRVRYTVDKASLVNLRAGIDEGGPLLRTLLSWYPRSRGTYTEKWDGNDISGELDISQLNGVNLSGTAYTLSSNTIIVGQPVSEPEFIEKLTWDTHQREAQNVKYIGRLKLGVANLSDKRDFAVIMEMPENLKKNASGDVVLSGIVPIRITASEDLLQKINNQRFEPVLFVDGKYQSEVELGFLPITWRLDTTKLEPGVHYLAVNLRGFDGEYGVAIKQFSIEE